MIILYMVAGATFSLACASKFGHTFLLCLMVSSFALTLAKLIK